MKKLLLGTSALVSALFCSSAAMAQIDLTIGGEYEFIAGFTQEDDDASSFVDNRESKFFNEADIDIDARGILENGVEYGARVTLEGDVSEDDDQQGLNASETSLFVSGQFGKVVLGDAIGPEETLRKDGSTFAYGSGGIYGQWYHFIAFPADAEFNVRPGLKLAHGFQDAYGIYSNASKVQYYTPSFYGFQLGVAYTPDVGDRGQIFTGKLNGDAEEVWSAGLSFEKDIRDVNIGLSLLGETGDAEFSTTNNVNDWGVGGTISYQGFSFGAGYYDLGDSFASDNTDAYSWNVGIGYDNAAWAASLGYHEGENADNETKLISLSAEYRLGAGLTPYAEINWFDLDANSDSIADNDGEVYLLGTRLTF